MSLLLPKSRRSMRGAVAVVVTLALVPLLLAAGAAVDYARAYLVQEQLLSALDSTALAVAAESDEDVAYLDERAAEFFAESYDPSADAPAGDPQVEVASARITVSATATVPTYFLGLIGIDQLTMQEDATAVRETKGLEVVLVLDTTGSMAYGGNMTAMRDAAEQLIRNLFGNKETPDNLRVSIVPFATAVNIGPSRTDLLKDYDPADFTEHEGTTWKGCVEARTYPDDVEDTTPTPAAGGKWTPYDWIPEAPDDACANPAESDDFDQYDYHIDERPAPTMGPNKGCGQPIKPFSNDRSQLLDKIAGLRAWDHGGTEAHLGMAWGMRMLSPKPPLTDTKAFDNPDWNKAIVVLTDGQNQLWLGDTGDDCEDQPDRAREGPYSPYGYALNNTRILDSGDLSKSEGARNDLINQAFDDRMLEVCNNIKAKASGDNAAEVFTITFKVSDHDTRDLFQNCASAPDNYYNSPSNAELSDAFRAIGAKLRNLRLDR